jgi:long-subunit acyl-CoA synthetase (AMP-forming)/pyrroloquinoline quinone (PQQ) biosynthesis protein C
MSLIKELQKLALQAPDRVALRGENSLYSRQEMLAAAHMLADELTQHQCHGIALLADNSPEWLITDLACQLAGIYLLPLPTFFSDDQLEHSINEAGVDSLIFSRELEGSVTVNRTRSSARPTTGNTIQLTNGMSLLAIKAFDASLPKGTSKITFTSGSSGQPKGVCLSQQQQFKTATALKQRIQLEQARHLSLLPLSTLLENLAGGYLPLLSGGEVILLPATKTGLSGSSSLDVERLLSCIEEQQTNTLILIPELLQVLIAACQQGWKAPSSLRFIAVGGGKVSEQMIEAAKAFELSVFQGYGLSECGSVVSLACAGADRQCGMPLAHVEVSIENDEIMISGNPFLGYLNQPDSWYPDKIASGDIGRLDEAGMLHILGRKKNLLISSFGRNINPEWIESEVLSQADILRCVVIGDARPFCSALIDAPHMCDHDISQRLDLLNQTLPDYAQVRAWHRAPQLSQQTGLYTDNGRPKREAINHHFQAEINTIYQHTAISTSTSTSTNSQTTSSSREHSMNFFNRLQAATENERAHLLQAPIIAQALDGSISHETYLAFLHEAFHHVKHTVPLLMAVGAKIPEKKEWLRNAVAEYIEEELGHQEWILNDIAVCQAAMQGKNILEKNEAGKTSLTDEEYAALRENARGTQASIETELMVAYAYDTINRSNPLGFFGMVHVLEGTSITTADQAAAGIQKALGLPNKAFTYLKSHGALDLEHVKFFEELMNQITDPQEQDGIIHSAKVFYRLYADIFYSLTKDTSRTQNAA